MRDLCRFRNRHRGPDVPPIAYRPGQTAPASLGLGHLTGQRVRKDPKSLSWHRAVGCCFWLAPFVLELMRRAYPVHDWQVVHGRAHAVVATRDRKLVADLLLFEHFTGRQSLLLAGARPRDRRERAWLRRALAYDAIGQDGRPVRLRP